jgi:hypothetical protein
MGDPLKVRQQAMGLEVWAFGTKPELDLLERHLRAMGHVVIPTDDRGRSVPSVPTPLGGADKGRYRWYLRTHVRTVQ